MIATPGIDLNTEFSVDELFKDVKALTTEIQKLYCLDSIPWIVGWSGGKDSSAVLQLVWNAIASLPPRKRTKTISIISTDTQVENPIVSGWVRKSLEKINSTAKKKKLPFEAHLLTPEVKDTFWVNLIGKGYPAPRQKFRWCTERLKIRSSNTFVREKVRLNGETILVLGTRKSESSKRASTMAKHAESRVRDRLSPNAALPNSLIYSPIEDWSNRDVWLYLNAFPCPWSAKGQDLNKELFVLYRGATADNDCPLVVDTNTESCGNSRFGCWVCTLVDRDKSMEAMILNDESKEWMQPLLDFRDQLDFRGEEKRQAEREQRDFRRMSGAVQLFERNADGGTEIIPIPGPYIKAYREKLLEKLLTAQKEVREKAPQNVKDIELISLDELREIRRIWREEKHEFDDALPRIYREVIGEIFPDSHPNLDRSTLGSDEWNLLAELCQDDPMHLELMAKLLDTERQFQSSSRRVGIFEALEKCFDTSSRPKQQAIDEAHLDRDLKQAHQEGDAKAVREAIDKLKNQPQQPPAMSPGFISGGSPAVAPSDTETAQPASSWAELKFGKKREAL